MRKLFVFSAFILASIAISAQHTVVLKSGDKIQGVVLGIQDDVLSLSVNMELTEIQMINVSSIFFNEYVPYDGKLLTGEPEKTMKSGKYTIRYRMKDRVMITPPKISNGTENKGVVVVDVVINRQGTVIKAEPGGVGSTTTSEYLYTKAKFAAMGARFAEHPTGPIETSGQIIITY